MQENKQKWLFGFAGVAVGVLVMALAGTMMGRGSNGSLFQGYLSLPRPAALTQESNISNKVVPKKKVPVEQPDPAKEPISRAALMKLLVVASGMSINTAGAPHFTDVSPQEWHYQYVETAYNAGWIQPYPDGSFKPGNFTLRAEAAKFFHAAFLQPPAVASVPTNDPNCEYPDVVPESWFHDYVNHMCHAQFLDVAPGTNFLPSEYLTVGTAEKWISNVGNYL